MQHRGPGSIEERFGHDAEAAVTWGKVLAVDPAHPEAAQRKTDLFTAAFMSYMPKRWAEVGGEVFVMPEPERAKLVAALRTVGDEVTKDDPPVKAFFERVRATAAKH